MSSSYQAGLTPRMQKRPDSSRLWRVLADEKIVPALCAGHQVIEPLRRGCTAILLRLGSARLRHSVSFGAFTHQQTGVKIDESGKKCGIHTHLSNLREGQRAALPSRRFVAINGGLDAAINNSLTRSTA